MVRLQSWQTGIKETQFLCHFFSNAILNFLWTLQNCSNLLSNLSPKIYIFPEAKCLKFCLQGVHIDFQSLACSGDEIIEFQKYEKNFWLIFLSVSMVPCHRNVELLLADSHLFHLCPGLPKPKQIPVYCWWDCKKWEGFL